jgi:Mn2+/Fe2+ NRAMP family transporter
MSAVQMIAARIGRASGRGNRAGNLRCHFPGWLTTVLVVLLLTANTINIGADLGAMADSTALVTGLPAPVFLVLFAIFCAGAEVVLALRKICPHSEMADTRAVRLCDYLVPGER